jgi:hypothetical protein
MQVLPLSPKSSIAITALTLSVLLEGAGRQMSPSPSHISALTRWEAGKCWEPNRGIRAIATLCSLCLVVIFSALTGKQRRPAPDRSFCRVDAGQVIASNQSLGPGMAVNQCGRGWLTAWNLQDVENSQPGVPDDLANAKD